MWKFWVLSLGLVWLGAVQQLALGAYPIETTVPAFDTGEGQIPAQTVVLSDDQGWLVVSLTCGEDQLEWRIALAKIEPGVEPVVEINPNLPAFSVHYGKYFIREAIGNLRVFRQTKPNEGVDWTVFGINPDSKTLGSAGSIRGRMELREQDGWRWACYSPSGEPLFYDAVVRLHPSSLRTGHAAESMSAAGVVSVSCGDAKCQDEGDLLVATRTPSYVAEAMIALQEDREK